MRRFLQICLLVTTGLLGSPFFCLSQIHPYIPPINHHGAWIRGDYPCDHPGTGGQQEYSGTKERSFLSDPSTMMSRYDMQTYRSIGEQRLYYWPADNTMAAVSMWSQESTGQWQGRGTGYNYFDGNQWQSPPSDRLETVKTGWPSLQPYGANGECVLSHQSPADNLQFITRENKGSGNWNVSNVPNPTGEPGMLWPRMITAGAGHMTIHIIALTPYVSNGGNLYNGMDGALLYIRSTDGGVTWEDWQQLPGMTSSEYLNYTHDTYGWAQSRGGTICFVVSDNLMDTFIMKSIDNGTTWTKKIAYHSPYNLVGFGGNSPAFFYCPDGTSSVALDVNGIAHVTFALECDSLVSNYHLFHQVWTNGIVYWNEMMPTLRQDLNPDSLFATGLLIGWVKDTMVFHQTGGAIPGGYWCSINSTPTMAIDDNNSIFVGWMSPIAVMDLTTGYLLSHVFERTGTIYPGNYIYWHDSINDLTGSADYAHKECAFPTFSPVTSADKFYAMIQVDDYAGSYVIGSSTGASCYDGQYNISDNKMVVLSIPKSDVGVGISKKSSGVSSLTVSDNFPNPCHLNTTILTQLNKPGNLTIVVTNILGQSVYFDDQGFLSPGNKSFRIDTGHLRPGIYFYTLTLNNEKVTKNMVVE